MAVTEATAVVLEVDIEAAEEVDLTAVEEVDSTVTIRHLVITAGAVQQM